VWTQPDQAGVGRDVASEERGAVGLNLIAIDLIGHEVE